MPVNILVATPHPAFGELLRLSLEESGQYHARLVSTLSQALNAIDRLDFALAILDTDQADQSFVACARKIQQNHPRLKLVVIPPDNNPSHPDLAGFHADGYLGRPFYLPDLLELVTELIAPPRREPLPAAPPAAASSAPLEDGWKADVNQTARLLASLMLESTAQAALIRRSGQIWASAGQLDGPALQELNEVLQKYRDPDPQADMVRFVHLNTSKSGHLLYATGLQGAMNLAMVFEVDMPLTRVRAHAVRLSRALAAANASVTVNTAAAPGEQSPVESLPTPDTATFLEKLHIDQSDDEMSDAELAAFNLAELLGSMPSPNPTQPPAPGNPPAAAPLPDEEFLLPWEQSRQAVPPPQPPAARPPVPVVDPSRQPTIALPRVSPTDITTVTPRVAASQEDTVATPRSALIPAPQAQIEPAETQPIIIQPLSESAILEGTSPSLSHLYYTCLLIPRLPNHFLTGELSERLGQWLPHLCLAFGWRLDGMAVRPETLQWTVQVSPAVSPGNVVRLVRQRTSSRIFNQFAILAEDNPSGDFWAPGYLVVSGNQPPSPQLLRDFIIQTRRRQGIYRS